MGFSFMSTEEVWQHTGIVTSKLKCLQAKWQTPAGSAGLVCYCNNKLLFIKERGVAWAVWESWHKTDGRFMKGMDVCDSE